MGISAARQPADAVRRLLSRADGRDPDPGAGADAGRDAARYRSRPFRIGDGTESDDRPFASADGHGVVRARARRAIIDREDHDGDRAVARAASAFADPHHVRAADLAVVAAHVLSLSVGVQR